MVASTISIIPPMIIALLCWVLLIGSAMVLARLRTETRKREIARVRQVVMQGAFVRVPPSSKVNPSVPQGLVASLISG
jgi:hypothetical protein